MLISLAIFGLLVWVVVQFSREKSIVKWKARLEPYAPVARHVSKDVEVTWRAFRAFRLRNLFRPRWWREQAEFRSVARAYDEY